MTIMKKTLTLFILALLVLTTTAWKPQSKGFKSGAPTAPTTTLPAGIKGEDKGNVNENKDSLELYPDSLAKVKADTLPSPKDETKEADTDDARPEAAKKSSFPWVWVALPTVAFLLIALAYRNVRRRYDRVKEQLDDAEQQLSDVRLLQNADKEQIHKQLQQIEEEKAQLSRAKTDAEKALHQASEEVEKLQVALSSQQAENDQLCDKNMQMSKQLRQLSEQNSQLKADIAHTTETALTDETNHSTNEATTMNEAGKATDLPDDICLVRASQCAALLDAICLQVQQTEGASPVISATLRQMQNSMAEMIQAIEASGPHPSEELFVKCLRPSGWMNNAAQLFAYSRLPQLCTQLQTSGVNIATLEQLTGQAQALLGSANMSMIIPAVLATDFDKDAYDYQNGDVWINKMFSGITQRDYEGKVFDILQVGYTVGTTQSKPVVKF